MSYLCSGFRLCVMKKSFLHKMNIVLGAASLLLAGCHSTKTVVKEEGSARPMLKYGVPAQVVALYGVQTDYDADVWTLPADSTALPDSTTVMDTVPAPRPRPVIAKYGIPAPMDFVQ